MIKVLFTGGGGAGNEAIYRLLKDKYELHFADADIKNISPVIPEDRRHQIPFANDISFIFQIGLLCERLNIDLLIPGVDEELSIIATYEDSFLPTKILLPDIEYIETMSDKLNMIRALEYKNIQVPTTNLHNSCYDFKFPFIIKPREGRGSRGVKFITNRNEWDRIEFSDDLIAQKFIYGTEYTVQMIANSQSTLQVIVPVKIDIKRGITIRAEIDNNSYVIEACRKIHKAIPTKGCYNIQCMLTEDNEVYPFEINPRISTTFCMTIAAGIDPIMIFGSFLKLTDVLLSFNKIQLRRHWTNYFTESV